VIGLVDALSRPYPCACACHETLSFDERVQGIAALFRFDDTMRGWGYQPDYELGADRLYRAAQRRNDASYRGVAVRDHACIHRRLVGFAVHELIHALCGDVTKANYGIPFGLPYGVPVEVPEGGEAAYLDVFNRGEARAWVGVGPLARALYGIDWSVYTARDVGTYGFAGGNAIVEAPAGFRPVPHWDRVHHRARYYALARKLEDEERGWFTDERVAELTARVAEAEAIGRKKRGKPWPRAEELARIRPQLPGRNDPCLCGSGEKFKKCCATPAS
jgi:hypothetical protein